MNSLTDAQSQERISMQASKELKKECEEKIAKINAIVDSIQGAITQNENSMTTKWALVCQHSSMEKECENKIASINAIMSDIQAIISNRKELKCQQLTASNPTGSAQCFIDDKIEVAGAFNKDGTPFTIYINAHESNQKAKDDAAFVQKWIDEHKSI